MLQEAKQKEGVEVLSGSMQTVIRLPLITHYCHLCLCVRVGVFVVAVVTAAVKAENEHYVFSNSAIQGVARKIFVGKPGKPVSPMPKKYEGSPSTYSLSPPFSLYLCGI